MSVTTVEWRRSRCSWCPGSLVSTLYCISSHLPLCQNRVRVKWWPPPRAAALASMWSLCSTLSNAVTLPPRGWLFSYEDAGRKWASLSVVGRANRGWDFYFSFSFWESEGEREREFASCGLHLPWHAHVHLLDSKFFFLFLTSLLWFQSGEALRGKPFHFKLVDLATKLVDVALLTTHWETTATLLSEPSKTVSVIIPDLVMTLKWLCQQNKDIFFFSKKWSSS